MASKAKGGIRKGKGREAAPVRRGLEQKAGGSESEDSDQEELERNFSLIRKRFAAPGPQGAPDSSEAREREDSGAEEDSRCGGEGGEDTGESDASDGSEESDCDTEDGDSGDQQPGLGKLKNTGGKMETREEIQRELSAMSFEEIMQLQNKVGTKIYNEVAYGSKRKPSSEKGMKRLNKNRPMEISAKQPVPFLRRVVPVKKPVFRDPRFDDLSGEYNPEVFEKTHKFIGDIKKKEKELIQKKLKKVKEPKKKERLQLLLKRMVNQEEAQKRKQIQRERELEFKRKQRELVQQGKRPFFLKKSGIRKLELAEKYNELKKSGKLESFLSKKRKRNAIKDRKKLPFQQKPHASY
uniref:rRNA biogenesis protein RRP36 n=1 Tax=Lepisosteus oculatus TaxID=7918 RepID=W5NFX2_LEPOC|nr:PREDICTED: ribosomal RNA processing protein 36 homolog [Lepisosteus oculatus]XP_015218057.1 PREDICTED: ribosomal RNA processing protein 36 homolog [Lepisosteus oculatus]